MARNNQLMYWDGTIDAFKKAMTQHCRRHRKIETYIIYKTDDPGIYVWAKKQLSDRVVKALRLRMCDAVRIRGTPEAVK